MPTSEEGNLTPFAVLQIPKADNDLLAEEFASRYRDIRLKALELEPQAYASTYQTESKWPLSRYMERLNNPSLKTFIGTLPLEEIKAVSTGLSLLENTWLGTLGVFGPKALRSEATAVSKSPWLLFTRPEASMNGEAREPLQRLVYFMVGVYVTKFERSKGLGSRLVHASLAALRGEAMTLQALSALCMVMVEMNNEAGKALYLRNGFSIAAEEWHEGSNGEKKRVLILQQEILTRSPTEAV